MRVRNKHGQVFPWSGVLSADTGSLTRWAVSWHWNGCFLCQACGEPTLIACISCSNVTKCPHIACCCCLKRELPVLDLHLEIWMQTGKPFSSLCSAFAAVWWPLDTIYISWWCGYNLLCTVAMDVEKSDHVWSIFLVLILNQWVNLFLKEFFY